MAADRYGSTSGFAGMVLLGADDPVSRFAPAWAPLRGQTRQRDGKIEIAAASAAIDEHETSLGVLSGRIDNLDTLRSDLGVPVATPASILRRYGVRGLARLRGAFSIAFWDSSRQSLLLASDPLGLRSVFYTMLKGRLAFATDLRDMLSLPGLSRDMNDDYLAAILADVVPRPGTTLYSCIGRVPAGCGITFAPDGSTTQCRYWEPDWQREIRHSSDDAYVEEARALLDQAVARQMRGAGPIVCQLSGGFDSGAVAATAARLRREETVHALTSVPSPGVPIFQSPNFVGDESGLAAATARMHPNIAWEALSASGLHKLDENPLRAFSTLSMPARNMANIGWLAPTFDRARTLGASAILTGSFGNMTLSWTGMSSIATWLRRGDWPRAWREAATLGRAQSVPVGRMLWRHGLKPLLAPHWQQRLAAWRGSGPSAWLRSTPISSEFAAATRIGALRLDQGNDFPADTVTKRRHWLARIQNLPPWLDPMSELVGVEIRDPTADLDLLEFCFAVPDDQYLREGRTRWLARRVLADRLPAEVLSEERRGFQGADFMHRLTIQRESIVQRVDALECSPLAARALDIGRMKRLAADWPQDLAGARFGDYGAVLHRGLHAGEFLRWIEGGNQ